MVFVNLELIFEFWSDTLGTKMFATSILIFDSYGMKSLYLKFGHPCQIFWSWVYCIALNWQHDDIDIDATSNSKRTYVQLDSFDLWSQQSYFRQESEMGRTYHRTPFKSCTSLYSPEAKMGSQKVTRKKKTIYSARWPLSLPSVFLSSKIPKVDVSFQCTMNLLFFTDNPKTFWKIESVNKAFLFWYWQRPKKYFFLE